MSETSQKIEALIFASSKPVSENEIKKIIYLIMQARILAIAQILSLIHI